MPRSQKRLFSKLKIWEKRIEKAPKLTQYLIFGACFILSLSIGLVMAYVFREWNTMEINKQKQEIRQMEQQRMNEQIEKFRQNF